MKQYSDKVYSVIVLCNSELFAIIGGILLSVSLNILSTLMFGVGSNVPSKLFLISSTAILCSAILFMTLAQRLSYIADVEADEQVFSENLPVTSSLVAEEKQRVVVLTHGALFTSCIGITILIYSAIIVNSVQ